MSKDVEGEIRAVKIERENPFSLQLDMPEPGNAEYVLQMLLDVGISHSNGMGLAHLTWTELDCWNKLTQSNLTPWESEVMVNLSKLFVSKHSEYDKKNVISDHYIEEYVLDRTKVSNTVDAFFRMLIARRNNGE